MAIDNIDEFEIQIEQFGEFLVQQGTVRRQKQLAKRLLRLLVRGNPVGRPETWKRTPPKNYRPGKSKANWVVSIDYFDEKERKTIRDTDGGATIAKGDRVINRVKTIEQIILIQNNVKYIDALNNGHSKQAPAGWINVAFAQIAAER